MTHPPTIPCLVGQPDGTLILRSQSETHAEWRCGPNDELWLRARAEPSACSPDALDWRYSAGWGAKGERRRWECYRWCPTPEIAAGYLHAAWLDRRRGEARVPRGE